MIDRLPALAVAASVHVPASAMSAISEREDPMFMTISFNDWMKFSDETAGEFRGQSLSSTI
jgi:hypothetical protein